jgi:D-aminopeptidase
MSVGAVSDAVARSMVEQYPGIGSEHDVIIPVVGECDDSYLNDISGRHVREEHVREALKNATSGAVAEGCVGGGTGMITCDFKAGIGTSSRKLPQVFGGYTLGVLVMSNFGKMHNLRVAGMPVGEVLAEKFRDMPRRVQSYGSIIAVVATDAPLLPHQISRLCKRVSLGIGRVGSYAAHGSGEIIVGFSTANVIPRRTRKMVYKMKILLDQRLDPLYEAVMEATEEAILNSMCMATQTAGVHGHLVPELPLDEVRRFVDATRPIFASVKKHPQQPAVPAGKDEPVDSDLEVGFDLGEAPPTDVRSAEGIPYPTRSPDPDPDGD